jgi:hypothetical protein
MALPTFALSLPLFCPSSPLMETTTKAPSLTSVAPPHVDFHLDEWEKEKQSCPVCKVCYSLLPSLNSFISY